MSDDKNATAPGPAVHGIHRAVIACDGDGTGVVLFTDGGQVEYEIDVIGSRQLNDLMLDDAPLGITIWEGHYIYDRTADQFGSDDGSVDIDGAFREPTEGEWACIRRKATPWPEEGVE